MKGMIMKKSIFFAMAVLALASCSKSLEEAPSAQASKLVFKGGFETETKTAFTEAKDGVYPLVWSKGDAIGIFSYDMTSTDNINIKANLLRGTIGQTQGVFIPVDEVIPGTEGAEDQTVSIVYPESGSERFFIYYPYNSKTDISVDDGCVYGTVSANQKQTEISDKQIGKNGFSYAMANVGADKQVNFTLNHAMAYVRVQVNTTDYKAYQLHSVKIYDKKGAAKLAGNFKIDPVTGALTVIDKKTVSEVAVTVTDHDFTATPSTQELYLTVLPGDFSAADLMAAVTFIKEDGSSACVPVAFKNLGNVPAASMTTVQLTVDKSTNTCAWYEPEESRAFVNGWAYGPQNTYYVESKAKGEGVTPITVDVKARGDFSKVREPKYYGWLCACEMSTRKLMQFPDGVAAYESVPTHAIASDYKITVECLDQNATGRWAVLGIYDEDYNLIWSVTFMRYLAGDEPKEVAYPGTDIVLFDRVLGASYSNEKAASLGKMDNSYAYYQWGRKDPFMWSNSGLGHYTQQLVAPNVDFEYAVNHPTVIFGYGSGTDADGNSWNSNGKWFVGEDRPDLWGAVIETGVDIDKKLVGYKTIYDPCPKGYRVADGKVLAQVASTAAYWELAKGQLNQDPARVVATNPFADASVMAYPLGNDKYDFWPYAGAHWGSNGNWGNRTSSNANHGCIYWGNSARADNHRASILQGCYFSSGWATSTSALQAQGFAVRCQKDEYGK